ncbi:MAG: InlB B-repeat-containing protein [Clostridia bacterium]|nr:InlB B-repeat-containing protein [Clostridia bacterium]
MKKFIGITLIYMLLVFSLALCGCDGKNGTCTVTFVQEGQKDIVVTVERGGDVENVPTPKSVKGYTVEWNYKVLSGIKNNLTVTAVKTPNTYTVTLDENGDGQSVTEVQVVYDSKLNLPTPSRAHYVFAGWMIKDTSVILNDERYTYAEDLTLVAVWGIDDRDEFWSNGY